MCAPRALRSACLSAGRGERAAPSRRASRSMRRCSRRAAEQAAAEAQTARLEKAASQARSEAERLRAEQAAAAQAIEAAEARITRRRRAAPARIRLCRRASAAACGRAAPDSVAARRLADDGAAAAAAGARRPGGADELVKVRLLLDSTLPVDPQPHGGLSRAELPRDSGCSRPRCRPAPRLVRSRRDLVARRQQFAALEQQAFKQRAGDRAARRWAPATSRSPRARTSSGCGRAASGSRRQADALAERLAAEPAAPASPFAPASAAAAHRHSPTSCRPPRRSPKAWRRSTTAACARAA